jgi:tripartite-type tricarboxylate transporter receptor subunit TctC
VPYKGSTPGLNDVISGHVPAMFVDLGPALGQVRAGRVRALGVSMGQRVEAIADVPPINDTVKGFDVASWQMFAAPSGTPRPVIDKLHRELKAILAMPDVREQILKAGMLPLETGSVDDLRAFVRSEIKRWGDVVRQAGIAGAL